VLKQYDPEVVRFFILRAHYRSPLNYSDAHLDDARSALSRLYTALKNHPATGAVVDWSEAHAQKFAAAMNDDFGTSEAIAVLFDLANLVNRDNDAQMADQLRALGGVLGLLQRDAQAFLQAAPAAADGLSNEAIEAMILARNEDRKSTRLNSSHVKISYAVFC